MLDIAREVERIVFLVPVLEPTGAATLDVASSEIGNVSDTTVVVHFNGNVNATDYKAGVTIKVNSVSQTINTATRQADHSYVHYVIASTVDANDIITWEYDSDLGDYKDDTGQDMEDIAAVDVDNWVGSHLYFDCVSDVVWVGAA